MLNRLKARVRARLNAAAPAPETRLAFPKFHKSLPGPQAALDLFQGRWASSLPDVDGETLVAGSIPFFIADPRPEAAVRAFGGANGRLDGFRVLELGPLEGAHAYALERAGADVLAIEGNAEAYLKCLVAKEILQMRSRFLLGDFVAYLRENPAAFDLIFASGVLYHMVRPLELIELICRRGARSLLWTHVYDPARDSEFLAPQTVTHGAFSCVHHPRSYGDRGDGRFWGGLEHQACWLARDDILAAFRAYGHGRVEVVDEQSDPLAGPSFTVVTSR